MKAITSLHGLFTAALTVLAMTLFSPHANAQTPYGKLIYQDDFSSSNSAWTCYLTDTHGNQSAIDASYGRIEGGVLTLKANVGCGWDYVCSAASLQVPLPADYIIEYRARKVQWCGNFRTQIAETNSLDDRHLSPPCSNFALQGNWFESLCVSSPTNATCVPPASSGQANGQWYAFREIKRGNTIKIFVDGNLLWRSALFRRGGDWTVTTCKGRLASCSRG